MDKSYAYRGRHDRCFLEKSVPGIWLHPSESVVIFDSNGERGSIVAILATELG